tara:strand:- start:563 stop:1120 length:558 start_codon:yes stop_codon:yes gene_type:complete
MPSDEILDLKNLHVIVLQEFDTDDPQELGDEFFRNLSHKIGKLKTEEYDGIEKQAKNQLLETATALTNLLITRRLEKISISEYTSIKTLTDEERFVIDSTEEMNERKEMIMSGIINGKSKYLETLSTKYKTKTITVRFIKESDEIIGADSEKYGPFKPEDVATIPNENAQALISNGIATRIRIEE